MVVGATVGDWVGLLLGSEVTQVDGDNVDKTPTRITYLKQSRSQEHRRQRYVSGVQRPPDLPSGSPRRGGLPSVSPLTDVPLAEHCTRIAVVDVRIVLATGKTTAVILVPVSVLQLPCGSGT